MPIAGSYSSSYEHCDYLLAALVVILATNLGNSFINKLIMVVPLSEQRQVLEKVVS